MFSSFFGHPNKFCSDFILFFGSHVTMAVVFQSVIHACALLKCSLPGDLLRTAEQETLRQL
jgi:hypothetical protein